MWIQSQATTPSHSQTCDSESLVPLEDSHRTLWDDNVVLETTGLCRVGRRGQEGSYRNMEIDMRRTSQGPKYGGLWGHGADGGSAQTLVP